MKPPSGNEMPDGGFALSDRLFFRFLTLPVILLHQESGEAEAKTSEDFQRELAIILATCLS
ncbi:hypothetical protein GLY44_19695 [Salmonella enterica]|nr:hypothetical protein [Salmonella enterica subsp. arizonae]EEI0564433.1 hypothetical protein [Salmonella enterica]ELC3722261.1 hypothetical protein [Salmonella enterica]